jgi:polysaccharide deacetylase family protein (PEP-CTERM system associated)
LPAPSLIADPSKRIRSEIANAMTIDVEDYFHVEAVAPTIDRKDWDGLPARVARNTERLLDILAEAKTQATFFLLGWIAQRHPALVKRIAVAGHEVARHGSNHIRVASQSHEVFHAGVRQSKRILEDLGGVPVLGYAPRLSRSAATAQGLTQSCRKKAFSTVPACIRESMISTEPPALPTRSLRRFPV